MMARRKHKMEHLPGVVRKRSFVLTLLVVAVILLCVLLTPQIAWLFESLVHGLGMLAVAVIRFIFSLFPDSEPSEYVEETPADDGGGMGGFGGAEDGSPWWNYIMWPLIITVALWLLYTYRDSIMRWFITLVRTFKSKVKGALFAKPKRTRMGGDGEGDYEDEVVELSASEVKRNAAGTVSGSGTGKNPSGPSGRCRTGITSTGRATGWRSSGLSGKRCR